MTIVIERSDPPCLSTTGAEAVGEAWSGGEAGAIARRRHDGAPPLIDGSKTTRLLNQPRVWKTVEVVAWLLTDGVEDVGREGEAIARLLARA